MRKPSAYLLTIALMLSACTKDQEAEHVIRRYSETVSIAYRTGDDSRLKDVATEREARIISVLIYTKKSAGLVLESTLESLKVMSIRETGPMVMIVETKERWRYYDRPLKPGQPSGPVIVADMEMEYECAQADGSWRVARVKTLRNTILDGNSRR